MQQYWSASCIVWLTNLATKSSIYNSAAYVLPISFTPIAAQYLKLWWHPREHKYSNNNFKLLSHQVRTWHLEVGLSIIVSFSNLSSKFNFNTNLISRLTNEMSCTNKTDWILNVFISDTALLKQVFLQQQKQRNTILHCFVMQKCQKNMHWLMDQ